MIKYDIEELAKKLEHYRNINLDDVKLENVDEISSIKIDRRKPSEERILDFLTKVKNSYIFKMNGKLVKICFAENTDLIADDCLTNVLKNLYK